MTVGWRGALVGVCLAVTVAALAGCRKTDDIHETDEARKQPCVSCHRAAYAETMNPQHLGTFPETCGSCHNTDDWRPAALPDHPWFTLDGKHASTPCASCHTGDPPQYAGRPTVCGGCHGKEFKDNLDQAAHKSLMGDVATIDCSKCHNTKGWGN